MSHAPDRRHNASKRRSSVARSSSARVSLTVARTDAAPSSCAHQQTHCAAVPSVEVPPAHEAVQHAGRHSEPLVQARDNARAKRNTRDRLGPKFKAIASIQAKQAGTGLHVHPGSLGSAGGFPFVCVKCNKKVSYPTDSCCPNNMPSKSRDVSKQGRRVVWKAILAKANKQAAAAKLCTVKEQRAQRAEANRLQRQDREREAIAVQASKPDPLGSLPVFPKSQGGVWWKCPWCDFAIQSTVQRVSKSRLKKRHLERVHATQNTKMSSGNLLEHPTRYLNARSTFQSRWKTFHGFFQQLKWKGAHDVPCQHEFSRTYINTRGMSVQVPVYKCKACSRHVSRQSLSISVCPRFVGKSPSLEKRRKIWQNCRKRTVKAEGSGDASATKRKRLQGLRGVRLGEASHPGPSDLHAWSQNIRSWQAHGTDMLTHARDAKVQLVFMQEHNISHISTPSVSQICRRQQWQALIVPKPVKSNGGVAVFCHESCALTEVRRISSESGQLIHAVLHGGQRDINVLCIYRHHSDADFAILHEAALIVSRLGSQDWILALDANANMSQGIAHDILENMGGTRCSVARHDRSVHPIDAIWSSGGLQASCASEIPGDGDHTIAQSSFPLAFQKCKAPQWRFSHTRKKVVPQQNVLHPSSVWSSVAAAESDWLQALLNIDHAWAMWCFDIENYLVQAGLLDSHQPERKVGDVPTVRTGSHRVGATQSITERHLRRFIRRLHEARTLAWRGMRIPHTLYNKLLGTNCPASEQEAVRAHAWGMAHQMATVRLRQLQDAHRNDALQKWRARMRDLPQACQWLRKEEAAPLAFKDVDHSILTSPPKIVEKLKAFWTNVFGFQEFAADVDAFLSAYQDDFPDPLPTPNLPPITGEDTLRAARQMHRKAAGLDGICPSWLALLPCEAHRRLAEMMDAFEQQGAWPEATCYWKIAALPKKRHGTLPSLGEVRPIAIGSAIYRIWGRIRLGHLAPILAQYLDRNQSGGIGGEDVSSLLLTLDIDLDPTKFPCLMALDFSKAFDSCDYTLALAVMSRLGLPARVVNLLGAQWRRQKRWMSFAGVCARLPIQNCLALPQGDPWSPIAMSLVLMLAKRHQERLVPESRCLLYLDDRTLVAPTPGILAAALNAWNVLHAHTRLRTNSSKTQVLGRNWKGYLALQAANLSPTATAEVLGVTIGIAPRAQSNAELSRAKKCRTIAQRISVLPVSQNFRAGLAALTLASKRVWGLLLNGRTPTKGECKAHTEDYRLAVKGKFLDGIASRHLEKVLLLGHSSDLLYLSCQRLLNALTKWRHHHPGNWSHKPSNVISALNVALSKLDLQCDSWGRWSWSGGWWDSASPPDFAPRMAHCFRQFWRAREVKGWLASDRNDAKLARANNLAISDNLITKLHRAATDLSAHEIGIMSGALKTDAKASSPPMFCHECKKHQCPDTFHVLWQCSHWDHLRRVPPSRCPLVNRLGWGPEGVDLVRVKQCAHIREQLCKVQVGRNYSRPEPFDMGQNNLDPHIAGGEGVLALPVV